MGPGGFFGGIASLIPALGAINQGNTLVGQGQALAQQGGAISAAAFRSAGVQSLLAANYNISIEQLNLARQLDATSREISSFTSSQVAATAGTGFKTTSGSFQAVINDSLNTFERFVLQTRNASAQRQDALLFEGQAAEVEFENRARAAEFQATVAASG